MINVINIKVDGVNIKVYNTRISEVYFWYTWETKVIILMKLELNT